MQRNSASAVIQGQWRVKKVNTRHSAAYTGLRTLITAPAATTFTTAKARKTSSVKSMRSSAAGGVGGAALGDLGFEPVPACQQLLLVDDVLAAILEVVFEHVGFDDGVHRAGFLAKPAEDALEQVHVVARGGRGALGGLGRRS